MPKLGLKWIPTRQPIALECFEGRGVEVPPAARRHVLVTVMSWEPAEKGAVVEGVAYGGKNVEFERFIGLPRRSKLPLEIAMSGRAPLKRMHDNGWRIRDPYEVSKDPSLYRDNLANSLGE